MNCREQDEKFEIKVYRVNVNLHHRGRLFLEGEYIALNAFEAACYEDDIEPYQFRG